MSWIKEPRRTWVEWAAIRVLRVGPIPRHVAFIMDGNRRYARQQQKDTLEGHSEGFKKLTEVLSWCRELDIPEVTVYAFSIENFKRSKHEVDGLMSLAEEKFVQLIKEKDRLKKHGVRIRVIGQISLLTPRLQKLIAEAVLATEDNDKCCLNLALAYTSREEISSAVNEVITAVRENKLDSEDIDEDLLEQCLYTNGSQDPDLLIRTSGEVRLSDFLLWQTGLTYLFFTKVLWPRISIWHFLAAIFHYQRHHHTLVQLRRDIESKKQSRKSKNNLENMANYFDANHDDFGGNSSISGKVEEFLKHRKSSKQTHLRNLLDS